MPTPGLLKGLTWTSGGSVKVLEIGGFDTKGKPAEKHFWQLEGAEGGERGVRRLPAWEGQEYVEGVLPWARRNVAAKFSRAG